MALQCVGMLECVIVMVALQLATLCYGTIVRCNDGDATAHDIAALQLAMLLYNDGDAATRDVAKKQIFIYFFTSRLLAISLALAFTPVLLARTQ
ncbi:unnamed protein product [Sphagnum balticum]